MVSGYESEDLAFFRGHKEMNAFALFMSTRLCSFDLLKEREAPESRKMLGERKGLSYVYCVGVG